jgi:hypothetical protein
MTEEQYIEYGKKLRKEYYEKNKEMIKEKILNYDKQYYHNKKKKKKSISKKIL